jgi:hypothetical protein
MKLGLDSGSCHHVLRHPHLLLVLLLVLPVPLPALRHLTAAP